MKMRALIAIALGLGADSARAGTFTANFNDGSTPPGMTLSDPAKIVATGGVNNSGYLSLTDAIGSQQGGAILDDLDGGSPIGGFTARMKIQISLGGNQPADGFSFNFADDVAEGGISEEGTGTGLTIALDTYDNGSGEAPAMDVKWGGNVVAHTKFAGVTTPTTPPIIDPSTGQPASLSTGTNFMDLIIDLHPNGTLDVVYKGIIVNTNLVIPDYTPKAGRFALGARTGGAVENHWIDDLSITTVPPVNTPVAVKQPPANTTVNEHGTTTLTVVPDGAPPFTFKWFRNGTEIPDATSNILTLTNVAFSENGKTFKARVSNASGSIDSSEATLTVVPDTVKPSVLSAIGSGGYTDVTLIFSEPLAAASATQAGNYKIDGGINVTAATLVNERTVRLTTSRQTAGTTYKVAVSGVQDTATNPNTINANSEVAFSAFTNVRGGLKMEVFTGIDTTAVQTLLEHPKYIADTPDIVAFVTQFSSRQVFSDSSNENYGGRISGWIIPAESGDYEFFIRSDDASQLYLSPDDNPANAVQIAEETGCCGPFEDPGAPETSTPQTMVANKRYYIMALWKEGGGGDYVDVAWRKVGDPTLPRGLAYIPGTVLEALAPPGIFTAPTVTLAAPASGSSFEVGAPVTFTANVSAGTGKTITKVDFFEQGKIIGTATQSPYSITLSNLTEDAHSVSARATDSAGITAETAPVTVSIGGLQKKLTLLAINDTTTWRYDRSGQDLGTAWRAKEYNDSAWPQGKALIADETTTTVEPIRTAISRLTDDGTYIKTFYFRTKFNFPGPVTAGVKLQLRHVVDDGAVFYLNGTEIHRFGIGADITVDATTDASGHENIYEGPFDIPVTALVSGENVLTAEVHQSGGSSSDMVFGAELVASIPAVTQTLLAINDTTTWRYDRSGQDLGTAWRAPEFIDASWPQGKALIADETTTTVEPIRTAISRLTDDGTYIKTFYFRTHFNFAGEIATAKIKLRHVVDDGAVFYLNGTEIHRFGIGADVIVDATTDASGHENIYEGPFEIPVGELRVGDNVLAAEVHQSGGSSSDMVFGAELVGTFFPSDGGQPPIIEQPSARVSQNGNQVTISSTSGGTVQASDSLSPANWTDLGPAPQTLNASGAKRFFRLKK